jgi:hypothetical protein
MATILRDADTGNGPQAKWAIRIRDRNHHRVVHETGEDANAMELKYSGKLLEMLKAEFPNIDFIPDRASSSIHKLLLPEDDTEEAGLVALPLIESNGEVHYLGERSHILRRVPRRFQVARIFADVPRDNENLLNRIRSFALGEYRKLGGRS